MNRSRKKIALPIALLFMTGGGKAVAAAPQTPALVIRACGPGDSWYRTELLVLSPQGELARVEIEEDQLKKLAAGRKIEFHANDGEFGENPGVALKLRSGMALFPCAVGQACPAVQGHLEISAYEFGKRFSGKLTWSSGGKQSQATFSANVWLQAQPECM